jgi:hypothetical protein
MMKFPKIYLFFLLNILIVRGSLYAQTTAGGKVYSTDTGEGIGYVNIGIIGGNSGTVSDQYGNFSITLYKEHPNDSLRFSMIGYKSRTFLASKFIADSVWNICLDTKTYDLADIVKEYQRPRFLVLGNPVEANELRSGFSDNELGSELGIRVNARKRTQLKDISLNVAICTYDSVIYRLNIYLMEDGIVCNNILTEPIYLSFSRDNINEVVTLDLWKYSLIVEGEILVTLELFKDLGEGKLLFRTEYFTGITYHRKTSQGNWTQSPGVIGLYLTSLIVD